MAWHTRYTINREAEGETFCVIDWKKGKTTSHLTSLAAALSYVGKGSFIYVSVTWAVIEDVLPFSVQPTTDPEQWTLLDLSTGKRLGSGMLYEDAICKATLLKHLTSNNIRLTRKYLQMGVDR